MNKKIVIVAIVLLIAILGIVAVIMWKGENEQKAMPGTNQIENQVEDTLEEANGKSVVVYFSATNNTKKIAETIQSATRSDIIEIVPKQKYTSEDLSYNTENCRANREQQDANARPEIENTINLEEYDTIYLGYPIWWGTIPKIILTLVDTGNLNGKTVIPFCTSGSTSITQSLSDLQQYNSNIRWKEGKRFSSSVSEKTIQEWVQGLGI